jgi:hypothetical protein
MRLKTPCGWWQCTLSLDTHALPHASTVLYLHQRRGQVLVEDAMHGGNPLDHVVNERARGAARVVPVRALPGPRVPRCVTIIQSSDSRRGPVVVTDLEGAGAVVDKLAHRADELG